jgi:DUF4097 and DUF4098 domain-containing protein YvlB
MNNRRKRIIIGALVTIEILICVVIISVITTSGISLSPGSFFYVTDTQAMETIERSFATDGAVTLNLANRHGDIQITANDDKQIVVKAVKEVWGQNQDDAEARLQDLKVEMTMDGDVLNIQVNESDQKEMGFFFRETNASEVSFQIIVPRKAQVIVRTHSGRVNLQGIEGDVDLASRYAPISIEDVAGSIVAETRNEGVTVRRSGSEEATVKLLSTYGDIIMEQVVARTLVLDNRNGVLDLKSVVADESLTLRTSYGKVALQEIETGLLTAETRSEDVTLRKVHTDGELNLSNRYGNIIVTEVIAGKMDIESNNGTLKLDRVTVGGELVMDTGNVEIDIGGVQADSLQVIGKGRITLDDVELEGKLDISTQHGAVEVVRTEASEYQIETRSDSITLDGGYGRLQLHNKYGDITVKNARDATLDLRTKNGRVTFEGSLSTAADHQVESEYADVLLRLSADTAVFLDASTEYGHIRSEFQVLTEDALDDQEEFRNRDMLRGTINDGSANDGAKLKVRTRNGNITLEES